MTPEAQEAKRQALDADFRAFLEAGGEIETIPVGAMAETGWTSRQRCNPQVLTKSMREAQVAEREARKRVKAALPAPGKRERPKAPKPAKPKAAPVSRFALPGSHKARILEALRTQALPARVVAAVLGTTRVATLRQLTELKERGLIESVGGRFNMTWRLSR